MFSSALLRRRRRAFSWILFGLTTFIFLCLWNFNSMDESSPYSSVHRFRLFGVNDDELPHMFYKLPADDPRLVNIVRNKFLRPPSSMDYNLTRPQLFDFSRGQSRVIDEALKAKTGGYFVECGAYDGEDQSVTLFFERTRNWRGLLVEPDRGRYNRLIKKHRKAHTINACIRTDVEHLERPEKSTEVDAFFQGRSRDDPKAVPCFWIDTLLLATNEKTVDLISLDLSDKEMIVLKSVDFKKTKIKTISLEIPISFADSRVMEMLNYMKTHQYSALHQFIDHVRKTKDLVLEMNDVKN